MLPTISAPKYIHHKQSILSATDSQDRNPVPMVREFFSSVDRANLALVDMEREAIELVNDGRAEEAIKILESDEYWDQKEGLRARSSELCSQKRRSIR